MQFRSTLAAAGIALVGAASATVFQPRAVAAEPPADISAFYSGKGSSNTAILTGSEPGGKGTFTLTLAATQVGNDLTATLTIDGGEDTWNLTGRAGGGRFWLSGDVNESDFVVIAGTAKGKPGKVALKGKGFYVADDHYSEMKISVKQAAAPE